MPDLTWMKQDCEYSPEHYEMWMTASAAQFKVDEARRQEELMDNLLLLFLAAAIAALAMVLGWKEHNRRQENPQWRDEAARKQVERLRARADALDPDKTPPA
ncbi:MAG: hypothetical protein QM667_13360 [Asticcacaulis sp.]